jgi:hypothetical protein
MRRAGNSGVPLQAVAASAPDDVGGRTRGEVVKGVCGASEIRTFNVRPANVSEIGQGPQAADYCGGGAHPLETSEREGAG